MIIDHIGFTVSDYEQSKNFYTTVLATLGIELIVEVQGWAGLGRDGKAELWFGEGDQPQVPMHIALAAADRAQVRAFHDAALKAGAADNGPPGIREIYHPNYYGAFVICPNGHNRSGPRKLDTGLSEISMGRQAAVVSAICSKYTASGVRRLSAL